jgi:hypothetical protein
MKIIVPKAISNDFVHGLAVHTMEIGLDNGLYYNDYASRGRYSYVDYPDKEYLTNEFITDYITRRWESLTVETSEDFIFAYEDKITTEQGDTIRVDGSIEQEYEWRAKVTELVKTFDAPLPFTVEFNGRDYNCIRYLPTVLLEPYNHWYNQGKPQVISSTQIIAFNKAANVAYNASAFNPQFLYCVEDAPNDFIALPWGMAWKNKNGVGNSVMICSNKFSIRKDPAVPKTIFDFLAEPIIWKKIILHMLFTPFDTLKAEFDNLEIPMNLQAKVFGLQNLATVRLELESLENEKKGHETRINEYIKNITSYKVAITDLEDKIAVKTKELTRKGNSKVFENQIKMLKTVPYLEKFVFEGDGISFYTKPIQINDDGPILGGYRIHYSLANKGLKIRNLGNPDTDYGLAHPHIYQDGDICFGNYTDVFYRFETGEYYIALELLHEFLSSYNPEDEWGRRLIYWDAKWVFEDMKARGLMHKIDNRFEDYYYEVYGEYLHREVCDDCGEAMEDCECDRCPHCNELYDNCECWTCPRCGELVEDGCRCERCDCCHELIGDCECERCDYCEELIDDVYYPHCECERCPEYDFVIDPDDLPEDCENCTNADCEYNEDPIPTQEETLFDEAI